MKKRYVRWIDRMLEVCREIEKLRGDLADVSRRLADAEEQLAKLVAESR